MHRWTARWLLLFALLGNCVPVALALSAAPPPHACCLRKTAQAHPCHGMDTEPEQLNLRSTGCCQQDCCRGVTVARWAQAAPAAAVAFTQKAGTHIVSPDLDSPIAEFSQVQSARAPPQSSIA
jgi:hypothetical protein